jgi:hypothetical protein
MEGPFRDGPKTVIRTRGGQKAKKNPQPGFWLRTSLSEIQIIVGRSQDSVVRDDQFRIFYHLADIVSRKTQKKILPGL